MISPVTGEMVSIRSTTIASREMLPVRMLPEHEQQEYVALGFMIRVLLGSMRKDDEITLWARGRRRTLEEKNLMTSIDSPQNAKDWDQVIIG